MINNQIYIVEDKGSAIKSNVIDVYVGTEEESVQKGVYYTEVFVKKEK